MNTSGTHTQTTVSPRTAAQMLGIRLDAVYGIIWADRLAAEKRDGRWFVLRSAVEARVKAKCLTKSNTGSRKKSRR